MDRPIHDKSQNIALLDLIADLPVGGEDAGDRRGDQFFQTAIARRQNFGGNGALADHRAGIRPVDRDRQIAILAGHEACAKTKAHARVGLEWIVRAFALTASVDDSIPGPALGGARERRRQNGNIALAAQTDHEFDVAAHPARRDAVERRFANAPGVGEGQAPPQNF